MIRLPKLLRQKLPDLGERELLVLEVLWQCDHATAQTVKHQMPDDDISLSTVQSTLERLYRKHLVERNKQGRAYCYHATMSRSQLISVLLRDMTRDVAGGELAPMISGFLDYLEIVAPERIGALSKSLDAERANKPADSTGTDDD